LQNRIGTGCADEPSAKAIGSTNVARLCRDRLFANRGRMPGFAIDNKFLDLDVEIPNYSLKANH